MTQTTEAKLQSIFEAAEIGGAALRQAIADAGGPSHSLLDVQISNVVAAAVNWCHSPHIRGRTSLTEAEHGLRNAVDGMLNESRKHSE